MTIEFCCLNCRNQIVADDADVGEKVQCDNCSMLVKVPQPIGGGLTTTRLRKPNILPSVSVTVSTDDSDKPSQRHYSATVTSPRELEYFDARNQPHRGFRLKVELPDEESLTEEETQAIVRAADDIQSRLLAHLEGFPETFERGSLSLCVNRWDIDQHFRDVNVRLVGLLNNKQISETIQLYWQSGTSQGRSLISIVNLINRVLDIVRFLELRFGPSTYLRSVNRKVSKKIVADLIEALDAIAKRPVPLGTRVARGLRFDN